MPKIGKIELYYNGIHPVKHVIRYEQITHFSIDGLSEEFLGLTGFKTYGYETEADLSRVVRDACLLYRQLITTKKLVIIYNCKASSDLISNKIGIDSYSGYLDNVSKNIRNIDIFNDRGTSGIISINFDLCLCINDGIKNKYYPYCLDKMDVKNRNSEVSYISHYSIIDYTPERYKFFTDIMESMKSMILGLSKFFDLSEENVIKYIESNQKLLS